MMKQISLLVAAVLMTACPDKSQTDNYAESVEAWSPEALQKLPVLPAQVDSALQIISPDTLLPSANSLDAVYSMPADADDVMFLPLAPTPGYHIGSIDQIEADDNLFFIKGWETEKYEGNLTGYKSFNAACFIFRRDGSLVARLESPSAAHPVCMAVNRQAREVCVVFSDASPMSSLLCYDYEGRLLHRSTTDYMFEPDAISISQNHIFRTARPSHLTQEAGLPQLTVCDPSGMPKALALSRPIHDDWYGGPNASFASCGDDVFYATSYSDTIWQVKPEAVVARYLVRGEGVGIGTLPFDGDSTLTRADRLKATEGRFVPGYASNSHLLVSPGFIVKGSWQRSDIQIKNDASGYFKVNSKNTFRRLVIDRTTGHSQWVITQNARLAVTPFLAENLLLTADDMLVSYVTPERLKYQAAHDERFEMTDALRSLASHLDLEANPVLLLLPLKHF